MADHEARAARPPSPDALADVLTPILGAPVEVSGLQRLTGGASRETWSFSANGEALILRRDPANRPSAPGVMRREADVMRACTRAGLRAPEVLLDDDGTHLGTTGLVMRRVPGETIARRILRDAEYASARVVLVRDLARFLAGLHAIDPAEVPGAEIVDPLPRTWANYRELGEVNPVFEAAHTWLLAHQPEMDAVTLVHGDLRMGNVIVGPDGLAAVIDWELIHRGDPHEDLAWLCLKAWRFGEPLEVGGLGTLDELLAAYAEAGGPPIDRDRLHWWLVARTLAWGIGCRMQAEFHLSGKVRSVDLAAVGRRVAEQEWDLIELLAPDASRRALAAPAPEARPDDTGTYGHPTARELLAAVRDFLATDVVNGDDRTLVYPARVSANVLSIVERQLAQAPAVHIGDDWDALALAVRDRLVVDNPKHLDRARALLED